MLPWNFQIAPSIIITIYYNYKDITIIKRVDSFAFTAFSYSVIKKFMDEGNKKTTSVIIMIYIIITKKIIIKIFFTHLLVISVLICDNYSNLTFDFFCLDLGQQK